MPCLKSGIRGSSSNSRWNTCVRFYKNTLVILRFYLRDLVLISGHSWCSLVSFSNRFKRKASLNSKPVGREFRNYNPTCCGKHSTNAEHVEFVPLHCTSYSIRLRLPINIDHRTDITSNINSHIRCILLTKHLTFIYRSVSVTLDLNLYNLKINLSEKQVSQVH